MTQKLPIQTRRWTDLILRLGMIASLVLAWATGLIPLPISQTTIPTARAQGVIYVDTGAGGANDGSSWTDAYDDLQSALSAAASGDEVWVAEGVYRPTAGTTRTISFQMKSGVALYGGFVATETLRTERDWAAHPTILSGDIGTPGVSTDNSYHVVTANSSVTETAVLDGFTVIDGQANSDYPHNHGAGMYNELGSPTIRHVTFSGNRASNSGGGGGMYTNLGSPMLVDVTFAYNTLGSGQGGGMRNAGGSPTLINVAFVGNQVYGGGGGGGIYSQSGSPTLLNVIFLDNFANSYGGGIYNNASSPTLINVTFYGNSSGWGAGSGMYNVASSNPIVRNSILWGNTGGAQIDNVSSSPDVSYCDVQGGYSGVGNIDTDPLFVNAPGGNLRLQLTSPAIDAGDNTVVPADEADLDGDGNTAEPTPLDLAGLPRFLDISTIPDTGNGVLPLVDLGAYEAEDPCSATPDDGAIIYSTIQQAVDAASPGDTVKAAGYCSGVQMRSGLLQTVYVSKTLTIRGGYTTTNWTVSDPDTHPTTLDALGLGRVAYIASSTSVTVENLSLTGGVAAGSGGGIYHAGADLALNNTSVFSNTAAAGTGGGVYIESGSATLSGTRVINNISFSSGGGIHNVGGVLNISNGSVIAHNRTVSSGFGGGIQNGGTLTVTDSTVRDNYASNNGGGIYNSGSAAIANAMILSNTMSFVGQGGGGLFNNTSGVMTIDSSTIAYNVTTAAPVCAAQGGGIYNAGTLTVTNSTISANEARSVAGATTSTGGGMYLAAGVATLTGTTISNNGADSGAFNEDTHGGGIAVVGSSTTLTLTNSTVSGNWASDDGGGIYVNGATVYLVNATISDNAAPFTGGDEKWGEGGGIDNYGTVYFKNTIIAGNTANVAAYADCRNIYGGAFISQGYNLVQTTETPGSFTISGDLTGNIIGQPALLGPLQDNGGDTETHAFLSGSPAIDAGTCAGAPATDQRGVTRPQGLGCDIGAYEAQTCYATPDDGATVYDTVQEAVDAAGPGGTVKVAGYCSGVQTRGGLLQTVYVSETLTVRGGYTTTNWMVSDPDTYPTTLDALGLGRVMVLTGTIAPTVEGLRITGGDATGLGGIPWGWDAGGGMYVYAATASISNCVVYSNTASTSENGMGGGIHVEQGAATLEGNIVQDNIASTAQAGMGGGVSLRYATGATLASNTVRDNIASKGSWGAGGGIRILYGAATLVSNTVQSNTAGTLPPGQGGGVSLESSPSTLIGNTVISNTASKDSWGEGGGISVEYSDALLVDNTIQGNTASTSMGSWGEGGGLYLIDSAATLIGNTVTGNTASAAYDGSGGGITIFTMEGYGLPVTLEQNTVRNNVASVTDNGRGGGLYIEGSNTIMLTSNAVVSNTATLSPTATGEGGGVWIGYLWYDASITMTNNLVAGNHATTAGSGLYVTGSQLGTTGQLLHNTIADNSASGGDSGQGVYVGQFTTLVFTNTIIAGHASAGITVTASSSITLTGTLWYNNVTDVGGAGTVASSTDVYGDPAFADPASWDYRLTASSMAIDTGVETDVATDFEGETRPLGDGFDIGYDESPFTIQADVAISKSVTPGIAAPNQAVTYTLTFTNAGPLPARGVLITDAVPPILTNVSYTNVGAVITPTGSFSYTWEVQDLAPGQGGVIIVTGVVTTGVSGVFGLPNQAEITTTTNDPTPLNNISTVSNTIDAEPPIPPTLVSPMNGLATTTTSFTLTWNPSPSPDVAGYLVDFDGTVSDVGDITFHPTGALADDTYTWTVAAYDALGNTSAYTDTWSFTVDTTPPTPPTLISLADGSSTNDNTPTLTWNPSPSADVAGYLVDFDGTVSDVGDITSYPTSVLADGTYTWTVAAYDALGNTSAFTDTWSFTVDATAPAVTTVAPADGATEVAVTTSVVIAFSEPIDTGTFNYTITPDPGGWSVSWSGGGTVATLTHAPFAYQATHTVAVTTAEDMVGNPLDNAPHVWSFTTAPYRVYLPIVFSNYVAAPDLVVEQIIATGDSIQVVVKNEGNVAVEESFWVDVYINPNPAPTQVNQIWPYVASEGLAWGVKADLEPGETLTLTVGGAYYKPQYSDVSWPLAVGTVVYAQVDSYNVGTTYGRVLENHEIMGEAYNNISYVTVQTLDTDSGSIEPSLVSGYPPVAPADLPPESKKQSKVE